MFVDVLWNVLAPNWRSVAAMNQCLLNWLTFNACWDELFRRHHCQQQRRQQASCVCLFNNETAECCLRFRVRQRQLKPQCQVSKKRRQSKRWWNNCVSQRTQLRAAKWRRTNSVSSGNRWKTNPSRSVGRFKPTRNAWSWWTLLVIKSCFAQRPSPVHCRLTRHNWAIWLAAGCRRLEMFHNIRVCCATNWRAVACSTRDSATPERGLRASTCHRDNCLSSTWLCGGSSSRRQCASCWISTSSDSTKCSTLCGDSGLRFTNNHFAHFRILKTALNNQTATSWDQRREKEVVHECNNVQNSN